MKKWILRLKEERASATIVEYTIILPICLTVLLFLMIVAFYMNQRALLDAAVERGVLDAQKIFSDPYALEVMVFSEGGHDAPGYAMKGTISWDNIESDPYRFLNNKYNYNTIIDHVKNKIEKTIRDCSLIDDDAWFKDLRIECSKVEGFFSKSITVTVRQKFDMPFMPLIMRENDVFDVEMMSSASMPIVCPAEFVRNIDFVTDTIERVTNVDITEKITGFFDKIRNFFENTTEAPEGS